MFSSLILAVVMQCVCLQEAAAPAATPPAVQETAEAETPAPVAEASPVAGVAAAPADPFDSLHAPHGYRVAAPRYDLEVSEAEVVRRGVNYRLSARRWNELLREDPELALMHRRGRLVIPGAILTGVAGVWLSISTALAIDEVRAETATGALFQWGMPAVMLVAGGAMTAAGVKNRRRLRDAQRRMFIAPLAGPAGGGFSLRGQF